jgi:hypothetical protein
MRRSMGVLLLALASCRTTPAKVEPVRPVAAVPGGMGDVPLGNRFAYIPGQCYAKTRAVGGLVHNPCFACHTWSEPPNFADDAEQQLTWGTLPKGAAANPWRNLLAPPVAHAPRRSDEEILAFVRASNYFGSDGEIELARVLAHLPPAWDGEGDGKWGGYIPDARYHFDDRGFDHRSDGEYTGWRALAYAPFPGAFWPTNGSFGDVLVRLAPAMREDRAGHFDPKIYEVNFAIVEALLTRADVAIDPVDERSLGADLDLDGTLGTAKKIAFEQGPAGTTRMRYVGRAGDESAAGRFPIGAGLFPIDTEFLHSVRYLDLATDGTPKMAARMKELRYAKKARWLSWDDLKAKAAAELVEAQESADGARNFVWQFDRGVYNGQGWLLQGFIEAADGSLRPQSHEETAYCAGCHGGIGATSDSVFSFVRKVGWGTRDIKGLAEPRRRDGRPEYQTWLRETGAGDDYRANDELAKRFFDAGAPRAASLGAIASDVSRLLLPSATRALDLDRAWKAIADEQSYTRGRDPVLAAGAEIYAQVPPEEKTGVVAPVEGPRGRTVRHRTDASATPR